MSADLMLVDENSNFEKNSEKCIFVDETSMGEPWHEFGKLISQSGKIDDKLIERVKHWAEVLTIHDNASIEKIVAFLEAHKGDYIQTECW